MNTIFFALWLLLSLGLLYFMGWTMYILYRQKQGWRKFAAKYKLRLKNATGFKSPEMTGVYKEYTVALFTGEHMAEDMRGSRKMTAIEINLTSVLPFEGAVASHGMVQVVQGLEFSQEIVPDHAKWESEYVARADKKLALKEYLGADRLDVLTDLMSMKNAWVIFIFRGDTTLLRLDTPQPLDDPKVVQKILDKMIGAAKVLELKEGEGANLKTYLNKEDLSNVSLDIKESLLNDAGLEIEEENEDNPKED